MRWLFIILVATQAATCGQRGPLTLPPPEAGARLADAIATALDDLTARPLAASPGAEPSPGPGNPSPEANLRVRP